MNKALYTVDELLRIKLLVNKFRLATCAFFTVLILLCATVTIAFIHPAYFPQNQHWFIIPLLLFWLVLLKKYPIQYRLLSHDIEQGDTEITDGLSIIHSKPGFKVIFSPSTQLSIGNLSFDLYNYPIDRLYIGQSISVKYFSHSKLLLSVIPHTNLDLVPPNNDLQLNEIELSIIELLVKGEQDKVIARELSLEPATVRTYNTNIYRKLNVKNRKQASKKALELGLVDVN